MNLNCSFGRQPRAETPQWALWRAGVSDTSAAGEDVGKTEPLVRSGSLQAKELSTAPLKAWLAVDVRGLACGGSGSSCRRGHARVKGRCFPELRAWVNSWDRPGILASCVPGSASAHKWRARTGACLVCAHGAEGGVELGARRAGRVSKGCQGRLSCSSVRDDMDARPVRPGR